MVLIVFGPTSLLFGYFADLRGNEAEAKLAAYEAAHGISSGPPKPTEVMLTTTASDATACADKPEEAHEQALRT